MSQDVKLINNDPPSALNEIEVSEIKTLYGLSYSVTLILLLSLDRYADVRPDEIVLYELNFAVGLWDTVTSLVAKVANRLVISPRQFNPSTWSIDCHSDIVIGV